MSKKADAKGKGVKEYKFKQNESLPENMQLVQVLNGNGDWIEAQFRRLIGNRWLLIFDGFDGDEEDVCSDAEAIKFFDDWRPEQIIPMVKEVVK